MDDSQENDSMLTDDADSAGPKYKPSFVLIAIDTHPSMFVPLNNEEKTDIPFKQCLSACYEIYDSLIFNQNKRSWSPSAVVLNSSEQNGHSLTEFNKILDAIKTLQEEKDLSNEELTKKYQRKGDVDLGAFFLYCKQKFKEIRSLHYKRTIVYITNDDNPVTDINKKFTALNEAKNFEPNDIYFQLVTMKPNFDYTIFYNEMFSLIQPTPTQELIEDEDGLMEKLSTVIRFRYQQRKMNFFPFPNHPKRFVKVVEKKYISDMKLYNNQYVSVEGRKVKKVIPKKVVTGYKLYACNKALSFGVEEYLKMKRNDLPVGFTLVMVSSRITSIGCNVSKPSLLEVDPSEDEKIFNSFWTYCSNNDKVLICAAKKTVRDQIRFVEFIPKKANNNRMFLLKKIPFCNQIRIPPSVEETDEPSTSYTKEERAAVEGLVDALTFDYYAKMFVSPHLAKKKAFLKAKLLDQEMEEVEDVTANTEGVDQHIEDIAATFNNVFPDGFEKKTEANKRKASAGNVGGKKTRSAK